MYVYVNRKSFLTQICTNKILPHMNRLTRLLIADAMAFVVSVTAHAIVPIVPAWVIYIYAIVVEYLTVYGVEKVVGVMKGVFKKA